MDTNEVVRATIIWSLEETLKKRDAEIERLREVAVFLFGLLDDIDTTDDVAKGDDKFYRNQIRAIHKRRFEVAETDGYNVKIKTAFKQKENNNVSE